MHIRRRPPNPSIKVANLEYAIPHIDSEPRNILEKIVWEKDKEIEISRNRLSLEELISQISYLDKTKDFLGALKRSNTSPAVIAEVKKASPSKGLIREDFDPASIAKAYEEGGASCISVLTDKKFFKGGFEVLVEVRKNVDLPILCKDFILMPYQLYQARASGADAALLIAAILSDQDLKYLGKVAFSLGLSVLVEVHDSKELERVLNLKMFKLIGINNRDLTTFEIDVNTSVRLLKEYSERLITQKIFVVSESGIFDRKDLDKVNDAGAEGALVGESLMRQEDIANGLRQLLSG